jgi:hypothetical protein
MHPLQNAFRKELDPFELLRVAADLFEYDQTLSEEVASFSRDFATIRNLPITDRVFGQELPPRRYKDGMPWRGNS